MKHTAGRNNDKPSFENFKRYWKKGVAVLAAGVVFCTTYALILPAITMEKTVDCNLDHKHSEECYFSAEADSKFALPRKLTGEWKTDIVTIAESQIGYKESEKDATADEVGNSFGFTKYGDWANKPYGRWNSAFAGYCLRYAGINDEKLIFDTDGEKWIEALTKAELFNDDEKYVPENGDLLFVKNGKSVQVAVVNGIKTKTVEKKIDGKLVKEVETYVKAVKGDYKNSVAQVKYNIDSDKIMGYGKLPEQHLICQIDGHVHGDDCYDKKDKKKLLCDKDEHVHDYSCTDEKVYLFEYENDKVLMTVKAVGEEKLPEDLKLSVEELNKKQYDEYNLDEDSKVQGDVVEIEGYKLSVTSDEKIPDIKFDTQVQVNPDTTTDENQQITVELLKKEENNIEQVESLVLEEGQDLAVFNTSVDNGETFALRTSSVVNPKFTVEYYANLPVYEHKEITTSNTSVAGLNFIDTSVDGNENGSGGSLPVNKGIAVGDTDNDGNTDVMNNIYVDPPTEKGLFFLELEQDKKSESSSDQTPETSGPLVDTSGASNYIEGLQSIGLYQGYSYYYEILALQATIAEANGKSPEVVQGYWSAPINTELKELLDSGKLINPEKVYTDMDKAVSSTYYGACWAYANNIEWGLASIGVPYTNELLSKIATANGLGTNAAAKVTMLKLLKQGKLKNPEPKDYNSLGTESVTDDYYNAVASSGYGESYNTDQTKNDTDAPVYKISTTSTEYTKIYNEKEYTYTSSMTLANLNILRRNTNYVLDTLVITKKDGTSKEVTANDVKFTNSSEVAEADTTEKTVLIEDGMTIRLKYHPIETDYANDVNFFDYDISDTNVYAGCYYGTYASSKSDYFRDSLSSLWQGLPSANVYMNTYREGINADDENYISSGDPSLSATMAFGNANAVNGWQGFNTNWNTIKSTSEFFRTDMIPGSNVLNDNGTILNTLNKFNLSGGCGCSFGMVTGYDMENDELIYNDSIRYKKLFNTGGDFKGKTTYTGNELNFKRSGDTYTLTAVNNNEGDIKEKDLDKFFNPYNMVANGTNRVSYTNNFWPLDGDESVTGHDFIFGDIDNYGSSSKAKRFISRDIAGTPATTAGKEYIANAYSGNSKYYDYNAGDYPVAVGPLPVSDDKTNHNSYFGMQYGVNFSLTEDYVGPLNYYFYGDDDLWVFLDGKLVCDLGGVHSSIGCYVDLWDWISDDEKAGTHNLTFFYLERGASGSSCFMQFTLPSVSPSSMNPEDTGSVCITKELAGDVTESDEEFTYTLNVKDTEGNDVEDYFNFIRTTSTGSESNSIEGNGGTFTLKAGDIINISGIPKNYTYSLTEAGGNYVTEWKTVVGDAELVESEGSAEEYKGYTITGTITGGKTNTITCINTYKLDLNITKKVQGDAAAEADALYNFAVTLKDAEGNAITEGDYAGTLAGADHTFTFNSDGQLEFQLKANETAVIMGIHPDAQWQVTEIDHDGFHVTYQIGENGEVMRSDSTGENYFADGDTVIFTNYTTYRLPETGGRGTGLYIIGGLVAVMALGIFLKYNLRKRRRVEIPLKHFES